jgi:PAS domain S-box-containing protein
MSEKTRIVMVEDSATDAELIQHVLKQARLNYEVEVVVDEEEYVKALEQFRPNIILSDHSLPRFSSREALRIAKAQDPPLPFILVTGTVSEEFAVESLKSGVDDYILKSALKRLPRAIEHVLQRKQTERLATEAFERNKMILDVMPAGCIINDAECRFTYWNSAAEKIFGFSSEEMLGKLPYDTITPLHLRPTLKERFALMKAGKVFMDTTSENLTRDGRTIICEWRNTRLTDDTGEFSGVLSMCIEVTEKVQAEREIMKFASLVESSTELIAMSGVGGNLIYLNKAGYEMVGLEKKEVKVRKISELYDEDSLDRLLNEVIPSVVHKGNWQGEFRFLNQATGKSFPVYLFSYVINDPVTHEPIALALIAHDITRQKESEFKLRKSEEHLQAALNELNTFIYRASHDLKGPLSSIIGLTGVAQQEVKDEASLHYLSMIRESTDKLSSTLTGLIETMRVRENNVEAVRVDLRQLIKEILARFAYVPGVERVEMRVEVDVHKEFYSLKTILGSILQNLVENAIKYHNYAEGTPFISIQVKDEREGIAIVVEDNGSGMTKEVKEKIFEMYFRGSEDSKGSGLGLYIVKTGIKRLNGTIEVESEDGRGSRFSIYLPSLRPAKA